MTVRMPKHLKRPHGWVDRACARLAAWYDNLRYGREMYEDDVLTDDGRDIADLFDDRCPHCGAEGGRYWEAECPRNGCLFPEDEGPDGRWTRPKNEPRPAPDTTGHGPGFFHDDAPAEFIPTERIGGAYIPNLGYQDDDTLIQPRPEPRGGRSIWAPPRPAHPDWVQRILTAPIAEVRRALETPDPDMYLWNMSQRRAVAA